MKTQMTVLLLMTLMMLPVMADESMPGEENSPASHRRASTDSAEVSFAELRDGDTVPLTFEVKFLIQGMGISPAGSDIENTGHHHLLIDVEELPDPNLPLPASKNLVHFGGGQTETTLTLPAGEHTLQLVFADYSHTPHDPVVKSKKITVLVSADAPEPSEQKAEE
jgi:hypothetical protein